MIRAFLKNLEIKSGDRILDFRGDAHTFKQVTRLKCPDKSAKVLTDQGEFYAEVFGLKVKEDKDP